MKMSFRLLAFFVPIFVFAVASGKQPKEHYHRYMLSDYRPQHNPRTQMDYKRHKAPVYPIDETHHKNISDTMGPLIKLVESEETIALQHLLVRIYIHEKFHCMGVVISEMLILTASTCFINMSPEEYMVKTSDDILHAAVKSNTSYHFIRNQELLTVLRFREAVFFPQIVNGAFSVRMCAHILEENSRALLPTYIRWRHSVYTQRTVVLALEECRTRMHDPMGKVFTDTMFCVRNKKYTEHCQPTFGNPLVYEGEICGINIMGHNCPKIFGVDVYVNVYSPDSYITNRVEAIKKLNIESAIF
ncbi:seminase [Drosophila tropicalis]|uniref:seminase n=1 Tax=Drosophila tropicalis TaxID=46794 RepID=UPI0035AC0511